MPPGKPLLGRHEAGFVLAVAVLGDAFADVVVMASARSMPRHAHTRSYAAGLDYWIWPGQASRRDHR
jgi:hypothetical protein